MSGATLPKRKANRLRLTDFLAALGTSRRKMSVGALPDHREESRARYLNGDGWGDLKKLWAAVGVLLLPIAYLLGRHASRTIVVRPPDVHVNTPGLGQPIPAAGEEQGYRRLGRHKILIDPYVIACISLFGTAGALWFAWQSNSLNDTQTELLNRQIAVEASQALPIFEFTHEIDHASDGSIQSDWLVVKNTGGVARNFGISVLTMARLFSVEVDAGYDYIEVPIDNYFPSTSLPEGMYQETVRLGAEGNAATYLRARSKISAQLQEATGTTTDFDVTHYIAISYQNYQGEDRIEHYEYGPMEEPDLVLEHADPILADLWFAILERYDAAIDRGLYINVNMRINEEYLTRTADMILESGKATPVASG